MIRSTLAKKCGDHAKIGTSATFRRSTRRLPVSAPIFAALLCLAPWAQIHAQDLDIILTPIGDPTWNLLDVHRFSAPAGSDEGFFATAEAIRGELVPTPPPYDQVWADGLVANGIEDQAVFSPEEAIGNPNEMWVVFTMVPDGNTTGSSFDFDSGPIIPQDVLPIQCDLAFLREGVPIDSCGIPLGAEAEFDGASRFHFFSAWPPAFWPEGTPLLGDFALAGTMLDSTGAGYQISVPLRVVPEPSSLVLLLLAGVAGGACLRLKSKSTAIDSCRTTS